MSAHCVASPERGHVFDPAQVTAATASRAAAYHVRAACVILRRMGTHTAKQINEELSPYIQEIADLKLDRLHGVNNGE